MFDPKNSKKTGWFTRFNLQILKTFLFFLRGEFTQNGGGGDSTQFSLFFIGIESYAVYQLYKRIDNFY